MVRLIRVSPYDKKHGNDSFGDDDQENTEPRIDQKALSIGNREQYEHCSKQKVESGNEIHSSLVKFKEPQYAGGVEKFRNRLKKLHNNLDYQVVGKVYLNFNIDIEGNIADVEMSEKLPKNLKRQIRIFLENTKGWKPAIHMNRRYPYNYEIPLNFSVGFNE